MWRSLKATSWTSATEVRDAFDRIGDKFHSTAASYYVVVEAMVVCHPSIISA
jgi:hypothetical protein